VGVRDVIAKLRAFAANVAYLCHCSTPKSECPASGIGGREDAFFRCVGAFSGALDSQI
jgi:hypothetical protein